MGASASVSGGVMFIPKRIDRTIPVLAKRKANDNQGQQDIAAKP